MSLVHESANALVIRDDGLFADVEDELGTSFKIILHNFRHNGAELLPDHIDVIRDRVVPFVQSRIGFAEIYGLTDRSGSRLVNYKVGGQRLRSVQQLMVNLGAPLEKTFHRFAKSLGEDFIEQTRPNLPDGAKVDGHRSVVIGLSPAIFPIPSKFFRGALADVIHFGRRHVQLPK